MSSLTSAPVNNSPSSRMFTIEGNIGCGKSTFLKMLALHFPEVKLIEEPVADWQNVGGKGLNILEKYYKEPKRWGLTFLNYVVFSRIKKWKETEKAFPNAVRITERSILADKHVFSQLMHDLEYINQVELAVYKEMYKGYSELLGSQTPAIIYLRCQPNVCHQRTKIRSRPGEETIPLDYLKRIHEKHEAWIEKESKHNVLVLETSEDFEHNPEKAEEMVLRLREFLYNRN